MDFASLVESWKMWDAQEKQAKAEKEQLAAEIIAAGQNPEPYGVRKVVKSNGYSQEIIPLLKQKGLRDAVKIYERPITTTIQNLVKVGALKEEEVAPFEKPQSVFLSLIRKEERR